MEDKYKMDKTWHISFWLWQLTGSKECRAKNTSKCTAAQLLSLSSFHEITEFVISSFISKGIQLIQSQLMQSLGNVKS